MWIVAFVADRSGAPSVVFCYCRPLKFRNAYLVSSKHLGHSPMTSGSSKAF